MKRLLKALWMMVKIILVGALAIWVMHQQGNVTVTLNQAGAPVAYDLSLPVVLSILIVSILLLLAITRLFDSAARLPSQMAARRERKRLQDGYYALTQSLVAIAAGDGLAAEKLAQRAAKKLDQPPLSLLIHAQAAQLKGDTGAANRFFHQLSSDPKAGFLGLRGQLMQEMKTALTSGQVDHARRLAAEAEIKEPRSPWVMQARFALEARAQNWREAEQILTSAARLHAFTREDAKWNLAALLFAQAQEATTREETRRLVRRAVETAPSFVPAAVYDAELLVVSSKRSSAADVIAKAWAAAPHPDLVAAWQKLFSEKTDEPLARLKWLEKLLLLNDTDGEALLARADALIDARLWGEARAVLLKLKNGSPDARCYELLAQLEMKEKGDAVTAENWRRAGEGLSAPAWLCKNDSTRSAAWQFLCPTCGGFATQRWASHIHHLPTVIAA